MAETSSKTLPLWLKISIAVAGLAVTLTTLGFVMPWNAASKPALAAHELDAKDTYQTKEEARREHRRIERRQQETLDTILEAIKNLER